MEKAISGSLRDVEKGCEIKQVIFLQLGQLCVKMNVDAGDGREKRNAFLTPGFGFFNSIVIQNTVVDTLGGSALFHFGFPKQTAARDFGKKAQIPFRLGVNNPAVV